MKAIYYKTTKTMIPNYIGEPHKELGLGYAYESGNHFVHIYGFNRGLYTISPGLTTIEKRSGKLEDWVRNTFGATDISLMNQNIGEVTKSIWRPGLYFDTETMQALKFKEFEEKNSEVKLNILLDELIDIMSYIEPVKTNFNTYGHKIRELLIIACTEVENHLVAIIKKSNLVKTNDRYTTADYVKLKDVAHLEEFAVKFRNYKSIKKLKPFKGWNDTNPTVSLKWYDSYNKTKHNSDLNFSNAKLIHVLEAVAANIILHCVRFGPYGLYNSKTTLSGAINQFVEIYLDNPKIESFYIPQIILPPNTIEELFIYDSYLQKHNKKWKSKELII